MRTVTDPKHDDPPFFHSCTHHDLDVLDRAAERIGDLYAEEERRERLARAEESIKRAMELCTSGDSI